MKNFLSNKWTVILFFILLYIVVSFCIYVSQDHWPIELAYRLQGLQSAVTLTGFLITYSIFKENYNVNVDRMMREENLTLLSDEEGLKFIYKLDIEDKNSEDHYKEADSMVSYFKENEIAFDRLLLMLNRIAYVDEKEAKFNGDYFSFYFTTIARSPFCLWYLSYGTFKKDSNMDGKIKFETLFRQLKNRLEKKNNINWKEIDNLHAKDVLYKKYYECYLLDN